MSPPSEEILTVAVSDRVWPGATLRLDGWRVAVRRQPISRLLREACVLSDAERHRLSAIVSPAARQLSQAAYVFRRHCVAQQTGQSPQAVRIGAPVEKLADGSWCSLSHTRAGIAVAVADEPVGIDIEPTAGIGDPVRLAHRYFAPQEAAALRWQRKAACNDAFAWRWCAKEALMKASGAPLAAALASPMQEFDVLPTVFDVDAARIAAFSPAPGFVCAVARARDPVRRRART